MGINFYLRKQPTPSLDVSELTYFSMTALSASALIDFYANQLIRQGNRQTSVGDWFDLEENHREQTLCFHGDLQQVHGLGAHWSAGTLEVHGSVGNRLGQSMSGGVLEVFGNVGDDAARGIQNGRVQIHGSCGDRLAAAAAGEKTGMGGGCVTVIGNAGNDVAVGMRRGIVCVAGDVGAQAGWRMLAGTLVIGGRCGANLGTDMVRGSIVLGPLNQTQSFGPGFRCGTVTLPSFIPILRRYLHQVLPAGPGDSTAWLQTDRFQYWHGDFARLGRGELLVALPDNEGKNASEISNRVPTSAMA